ncbi:MAG: C1 family peptidase [Allosphingosinicella sp.]
MAKGKAKENSTPELGRICNLVPSRNVVNDWRMEHAIESQAIAAPPAALPASVDLRAAWWNVGNQEATGSCVGWGSTDGVARYHFVKAGRLGQAERLSPRFTWMACKETDTFVTRPETFIEGAGTSLKAAVDILRKYGAVPEALLPFHVNTNLYLGNEDSFYATAATRKIASYFNLFRNLPDWRNWLATHGPLLVGLNVDRTWDRANDTLGKLDIFQPNTVRGGHAVAVVGYRADGRFIVRNSWGTAWGDNGFAYPSEAYINAAFYNESYGVVL